MTLFFSFVMACFITMALIPPLMRSAERLKFVDVTDERKVHTGIIPRVGGIAMVAGTVLPMLMWLDLTRQASAFLIGVAIIVAFGVWDDRKDLDYRLKFFGQIVAIGIVVWYGDVLIRWLPFTAGAEIPLYVSALLTGFILLGVTNAVNLADGLDGLAGGMMLLSFGAIALLGYIAQDGDVLLIAMAISGGILGFLRFNTYPARIFMGDSGSQFLGFSIGVLAIAVTQQPDSEFSPSLPLLLLGLPILDTAMVMSKRISQRRSPFSPDKNHIHHRLLAIGLDHYEAVFLIYIVQAGLVVAAYWLRTTSDSIILTVYGVFCVSVIVALRFAATANWERRKQPHAAPSWLSRQVRRLTRDGLFSRFAFTLVALGITVYLMVAALLVDRVSDDVRMLAVFLLLTSLVSYVFYRRQPLGLIERATLFVTCTLVVYVARVAPEDIQNFNAWQNGFFLLLALTVIAGLRFAQDKRFEVTPLDFLIIFLAFTVPHLPDPRFQELKLGEAIARLIVLFYAIEAVLANITGRHNLARYGTWMVLGTLALKGVL